MQNLETKIKDAIIIVPDVYPDNRGCFFELWNRQYMLDYGIDGIFVQDNIISSLKGVLRGMHTQKNFPQSKLVSRLQGSVFDAGFLAVCRNDRG